MAASIRYDTSVSSQEKPKYNSARLDRYKNYESMVEKWPKMLDSMKLMDMSFRIYDRINGGVGRSPIPSWLNITPGKIHNIAYELALYGDYFAEIVGPPVIDQEFLNVWSDEPSQKIEKWIWDQYKPTTYQKLPCQTMFRIEDIKGKVVEFQQSKVGPNYSPDCPVWKSTGDGTMVRFGPWLVVHIRSLPLMYERQRVERRKEFYPYGVSVLDSYNVNYFENSLYEGIVDLLERFI